MLCAGDIITSGSSLVVDILWAATAASTVQSLEKTVNKTKVIVKSRILLLHRKNLGISTPLMYPVIEKILNKSML